MDSILMKRLSRYQKDKDSRQPPVRHLFDFLTFFLSITTFYASVVYKTLRDIQEKMTGWNKDDEKIRHSC
jgi:hypothetical protein